MTAPALKWQKDLKAHADAIIDKLQPVEKTLLEKKAKIDDAKKAMEQKLFTDRCKLLAENGYQLTGQYYICGALQVDTEMIVKLTEDEFTFYVNEGEKELKRVEAEKQRKKEEDEALAKRLEELDRREAELKAREAELKKKENEVEAQTTALEENYEKIEKPDSESPDEQQSEPTSQNVGPQKDAFGDVLQPANVIESKDIDINVPIRAVKDIANHVKEKLDDAAIKVDETFQHAYRAGFEDFKQRMIDLVNSPEKITRAGLISWAESQTFDGDETK